MCLKQCKNSMLFSVDICVLVIETYFETKSHVSIRNCSQHVFGREIENPNLTIEHFVNEHRIDEAPHSGRLKVPTVEKQKEVRALIEATFMQFQCRPSEVISGSIMTLTSVISSSHVENHFPSKSVFTLVGGGENWMSPNRENVPKGEFISHFSPLSKNWMVLRTLHLEDRGFVNSILMRTLQLLNIFSFYPTTQQKSGNVFGRGVHTFVRSFPHRITSI